MLKSLVKKIVNKNMPENHILEEKEIQKIMEHNKNVLKKNIHNTLCQEKGINNTGMRKNIYL